MFMEVPPSGTRGRAIPRLPGAVMRAFNTLAFRVFGSVGLLGGRLLRLTTVGARSGQRRQTTLLYFPDRERFIVVASFGGTAKHPAWYLNLAKHPDQVWVERGRQKMRVTPELLRGEERERLWREIVSASPMYANYQRQTDREIPLVRLSPVPQAQAN
jgi:deazaflavin-dependent oxidoreductase (nitroreductase family)